MNVSKRIAQIISVLELIMAIVMYFAVAYQFENDPLIIRILPHTDFEATLLRLSIYIIPGINIIAGVFGITFNTRGILCFAGVLEIIAGIITLYYKGKSVLMNTTGIMMIVMGVLFIICVLLCRDLKTGKKKKDK